MTAPAVAVRSTGGRVSGARSRWTGWVFVGPFMATFLFVLVAPLAYALYLSLFTRRLVGGEEFTGLGNYVRAIRDPLFIESVGRILAFFAIHVPLMLGLALVAALALDSARLRFTAFFRLSLFMPYAVPSVVAALMWGFIYGPRFGLVANVNTIFGLSIPSPFSSDYIMAAIVNIATWSSLGYNMLILYAVLRAVPSELYEAAELDGAGQLRIVWSIKLPALRPGLTIALIFSIIGSFQLFNSPQILKGISPNAISTNFTPNMYAYSLSFTGQQFSYAAAVAIVMGIVTMIIAYGVQLSGTRRSDR